MALIRLTDRAHLCPGGVNLTLIEAPDRQLILVDSGLDSGAARKALRPFLEAGFRLAAILNTHSHADHVGGNADLVRRTGCQVWAPPRERPFILWPELEAASLYGGACPPPGMAVKFLQAPPTPEVMELPAAPGTFRLAGVTMEIIPVPGHSLQQVAIAVDGVLVAADALFMPEIIAKHPLIFLVDAAAYRSSLERLAARTERYVVPGHGSLIDRCSGGEDPLSSVVAANLDALGRVEELILDAVRTPMSLEAVLSHVWARLGKAVDSEPQYHLDRTTVAAHTSDLLRRGLLAVQFEGGRRLLTR